MNYLGQGIYGLAEVARLTGTNVKRLRPWFVGRSDRPGSIIRADDLRPGRRAVSFHALIDALVVVKLRDDYGVSMQYLRKVHGRLIDEFDTPHPFSRKNFLTDGKQVFVSEADELGEEHLKEILSRQQAFPKVLRDYLKLIEYDSGTLLARKWHISHGVVIDPERRYGKPIVDSVGIATGILAATYEANNHDVTAVAHWYGISHKDVMVAVEFEQRGGIRAA
jgi:uncharacterized protein (DUF433 family)